MNIEMPKNSRPLVVKQLHFLLVLSFINTGLSLLSEIFMAAMLPSMSTFFDTQREMFPDEMAIMIDRTLGIPQWYFLILALLDAASVVGLVMMWQLRKNGFHCYALSKLLLILMPLLFLDRMYISIGNIMIAMLMIGYYYVLMRGLRATEEDDENQPESTSEEEPAETADEAESQE